VEKVLFVCVENAGRSQMAEAFFRKYASPKFNVISAGTTPSSKLNPIVVEVMREVGIEMLEQSPKTLSNEMIENSSKTINMGCMDKESCPALFIDEVINWEISDPKEKSIEDVREIRDEILKKVLQLIESFEK
jgi:arsenate reductase